MKSIQQILVFYASSKGKNTIEKCLQRTHYLEIKGIENKLDRFESQALKERPDILIFEDQNNESSVMSALERLAQEGMVCMLMSESNDSEHILEAFRKGAREYLVIDDNLDQSFQNALIRLTEKRNDKDQLKKAHRIAIIGAKGGVGVSHLSVNLAWTISNKLHQKTLLVDLDASGAKDAFMLDLIPERTFLEFASGDPQKHSSLAHQVLTHITPNFALLPLPENPADIENITSEHVQKALDNLESRHDIILLDLSHHLNELSLFGMDCAQTLILVIEPTVISLKAGLQKIQLMEKMGYDRTQIHIVINRYNRKQALGPQQVSNSLDLPVFGWLPCDEKHVTQAENSGKPVCFSYPGCKYAKKIFQVADMLLTGSEED
ncbi:response regulator receiver protein [Candidatus Magnetomorum sp. HK-1]|nr:response regulator receiver protein [Candidatus Magnetomorum sp. HK-1]